MQTCAVVLDLMSWGRLTSICGGAGAGAITDESAIATNDRQSLQTGVKSPFLIACYSRQLYLQHESHAPMYQYNCKYTSLVEQIYAKICLGRVVPGFVRDDGSKLVSSLTCSISAVYDSSATFEPEEKAESCTPRYLRYSRRRRYSRFAHGADPQCGTTCSDIAADGSTRPMQVPDIAAIMTDRAVLYMP
jgi:hypothetical protein